MRFGWRTDEAPLRTHREWVEHIDPKNRQPGTSAPTLAAVWSGPLDLLGALATEHALDAISVDSVIVEEKATFDSYGGNVRNHDLVLRGTTPSGEGVVVCVEAKAGETLGDTVLDQRARAARRKTGAPTSNALARLDDLLARLCRDAADHERNDQLRYQLLTGWAGTLADAEEAHHAVFALHEFRTDQRSADESGKNHAELARFADAVLGCELPPASVPWCIRVPDVNGVDAHLYLAHVVTDLRAEAVHRRQTSDHTLRHD